MSNAAIDTGLDSDAPVSRLLPLERLLHQDAEMSPEARSLAHDAAVRMFDLDAEEVGLRDPGSLLGPYRIVRLLGCGGQALVYEAEDTDLGRRVALKVPRPGVGDRLLKEARAVGALNHPNVVRVEALREHEGQDFLVMELCSEGNLYDLLEGHPEGLSLDLVKRIGDQVLSALAHAHAQGVVHRDVKPGNVLFQDGVAKLGDFGIGKITDEGAFEHSIDASQMTQGAVGTPLYMAPEQRDRTLLRGEPLDGRTDLYGFGRMLWYMVTGRTPDDYQPASRARPGLDPAWDELIWSLTERERAKRPEDAESVRGRLMFLRGNPPPRPQPSKALASGGSVSRAELLAPHKPEWEKPPHLRKHNIHKRWRRNALAAGIVLFVLLFTALLGLFVSGAPAPAPEAVTIAAGPRKAPRPQSVRTVQAYEISSWGLSQIRAARTEIADGRYREADKLLLDVFEQDRRLSKKYQAQVWALLAESYIRQGRHTAGTQASDRARRLDPRRYGADWYWNHLRPLIEAKRPKSPKQAAPSATVDKPVRVTKTPGSGLGQ